MIKDVAVKPLKVLCDERGRLMEMLRCDDPIFKKFGQIYLTTAYPGVVKAWHYHRLQWDHFVVVAGMMKVVLFDSREDSPTQGEVTEFFMGPHNPILLQIPPLVCHGLQHRQRQRADESGDHVSAAQGAGLRRIADPASG